MAMLWTGECFERFILTALQRIGLSGAIINIGRTLGIYSGDQDEMMAIDLGSDNSNGEKCRDLGKTRDGKPAGLGNEWYGDLEAEASG